MSLDPFAILPKHEEPTGPKPWWQSKTNIATLVLVLANIFDIFGLQVDRGALADIVSAAVALGAGAFGLYGRAKAVRPIRPIAKAKTHGV